MGLFSVIWVLGEVLEALDELLDLTDDVQFQKRLTFGTLILKRVLEQKLPSEYHIPRANFLVSETKIFATGGRYEAL